MKRVFDFIVSAVALVVLSPLLIFVALLIRWKMGSPVFFGQMRPGCKGRSFTLYKFRTMNDSRDDKGQLLSDNIRLTAFGRFLRSTSIDELPELFNVIKGDMSIVGPRPLLMQYLERYSPEQARRHEVKPGITGWALDQLQIRYLLLISLRVLCAYVYNRTMLLDLKFNF